MHGNLNELMQSIVDLEYPQLLARAKTSLTDACNIFTRFSGEAQAGKYVFSFLATAIAVDGKFSELEQRFIRDLFGDDDLQRFMEKADETGADAIDQIVDSLSAEDKMSLCLFAAYIIAVDGRVHINEYDYLKKLVA